MSKSKYAAQCRVDQVGPKTFKSPPVRKNNSLTPISKHGKFANGKRGMGSK